MSVRFTTMVQQEKGTSPFVDVPADSLGQISATRGVPVTVTVNGYTFHTAIVPWKGCLLLAFTKANAAAAGVAIDGSGRSTCVRRRGPRLGCAGKAWPRWAGERVPAQPNPFRSSTTCIRSPWSYQLTAT